MTETDINHKSTLSSDIKTIVVAYNAPRTQPQQIRVMNTFGIASTHDARRVRRYPLNKGTRLWKCGECGKFLSSKRSFNEHMNIHEEKRPFECEYCDYAAASQMTLRRHVLRNHTDPLEWGYKCPYCSQFYMEPASYQQHIQSRHFGKSCTFGCPYHNCQFTTKGFRHFREHLAKHDGGERYIGSSEPQARPDEELTFYLVDDECGEGYKGGNVLRKRKIKPAKAVIYTNDLITRGPPTLQKTAYIEQGFVDRDDYMKQPLHIKPRQGVRSKRQAVNTPPLIQGEVMPADNDWIENEIEVATVEPLKLADGQEDFDLD